MHNTVSNRELHWGHYAMGYLQEVTPWLTSLCPAGYASFFGPFSWTFSSAAFPSWSPAPWASRHLSWWLSPIGAPMRYHTDFKTHWKECPIHNLWQGQLQPQASGLCLRGRQRTEVLKQSCRKSPIQNSNMSTVLALQLLLNTFQRGILSFHLTYYCAYNFSSTWKKRK